MHDLERAFRAVTFLPMNGFGPLRMPREVQLVVALWATKTWMLMERSMGYLRGGTTIEISQDPYRWMGERKEPPPQTQVWIGAVDPDSARATGMISFVATQWVGADDPPVGMVGVFSIGSLLFVVYTPVTFPDLLTAPPLAFSLAIRGGTAEHLREIWPNQAGEVQWPPPRIFAADQLEVVWPSGGRIRAAKEPP